VNSTKHSSSDITCLIFDLFGVLIGTDQSTLIHYLSSELDIPYIKCREIVTGEIFMRYERRETDFTEYVEQLHQALPGGDRLDAEQIRIRFLDHQPAELPLTGILPQLKENYKLWLLSNTTDGHVEYLKLQFEFFRYFDGYTTSQSAGTAKPNSGIYLKALNEIGAAPEQCIFFDDAAANAEGANQAGIKGFHYIDFEQSVQFLSDELKIKIHGVY